MGNGNENGRSSRLQEPPIPIPHSRFRSHIPFPALHLAWVLVRALYWLIIAVPLAAQTPRLSAFQEHKALKLLREQLSCLGCHELAGEGGRIAPSLSDVGRRRDAAYIRAIVEDPQRIVPGAAMPKVVMPATIRDLVVAYLTRDAATGVQPQGQPVAQTSTVSQRYARWCSSCHGNAGGGDGPNARYLPVRPAVHASSAQMSARSDDALFDAIAGGGAIMGKSSRMPPFGGSLSSREIRELVAYIRALCACRGPAWSLDGNGKR